MTLRSIQRIKWWIFTISAFVILEEAVYKPFLSGLSKPSSMLRPAHEENGKSTIMRARKLLEDVWNPLPDSISPSVKKHRLPSCIIIGARKCGTRALLEFLEIHPQIVINIEEMHFFSNDTNYMKGVEWYQHQMPASAVDQITIEKTPRYFISPVAPARMHRMNPWMKLIVILRHPTTRVISDFTQIYTHRLNRNETTRSFESLAIDNHTGHVNVDYKAVQISVYHRHLAKWLNLFPLSQILIVDGDALIKNPIPEIHKVETFLGLKHQISSNAIYFNSSRGFYCMHQSGNKPARCLGASKGRKHVYISDWVKKKLNNYFKPHNEVLFKQIKRRFRWR